MKCPYRTVTKYQQSKMSFFDGSGNHCPHTVYLASDKEHATQIVNDFSDCLKEECPHYFKGLNDEDCCARAEKEAEQS